MVRLLQQQQQQQQHSNQKNALIFVALFLMSAGNLISSQRTGLVGVKSIIQEHYDRASAVLIGGFKSFNENRTEALQNYEEVGEIEHTNTTHWCVISPSKMPIPVKFFWHFPHCMEMALPCWSWFRSQHATKDCGFVLVGGLRFDKQGNSTWQNQLVTKHMGCKVLHVPNEQSISSNEGVFHSPNLKFLRPTFGRRGYLQNPDDAQALRRVVGVTDAWVASQKGNGKPLRIGIIQRTEKRVVTNMNDVAKGLQQALPEANITISTFGYPTVLEQAKWFASKDVIVAAHGAALTNSVFATKGTFILQLYPPGFYWQSLDPLIEQSGAIALDWYKGDDPVEESITVRKNPARKNDMQHQDFEVPVDEIVDILLVALDKKEATPLMMKKSSNY
ncbi:glycosyltransferase [Seminavis robusta]|uniref:Glycosyltransferase n=1 Tax=Seminavis robusta TaxID=568900 RepID=A0A9N8DC79_9STRA|nr:glycosyltransferase [Seminavis robusta]|eukprot:Sro31_g020440.1 glycosyltransferase (390) ;mRNA; f:129521-130690